MSGTLYLVATPIGNLGDITVRALDTLKKVNLIAAEDTRQARKLLTHYEIQTRLTSYHSHNEHRKTAELIELLQQGEDIAVISDAGMPCIADPGFLLVREAVVAGIEPEIIPGVSAMTFAVAAAGAPVDRFLFAGFLSNKGARRRRQLEELLAKQETLILFESVHRISKMIADVETVFGAEQPVVVIREATKLHEERLRMTAGDFNRTFAKHNWKGEFVIILPRPERRDQIEQEV